MTGPVNGRLWWLTARTRRRDAARPKNDHEPSGQAVRAPVGGSATLTASAPPRAALARHRRRRAGAPGGLRRGPSGVVVDRERAAAAEGLGTRSAAAEGPSGGGVREFFVSTAAGSEDPSRGRGHHREGAEHSTGPQLVQVGKTDSGKCVEKVGLGGADAVRGLGAGAKGAAGCHAVIVSGASTASAPACSSDMGQPDQDGGRTTPVHMGAPLSGTGPDGAWPAPVRRCLGVAITSCTRRVLLDLR